MIEAMNLMENPPAISLIVISVANVNETGTSLSPEIQAVLPEVIELVKDQFSPPTPAELKPWLFHQPA